MNEELKDVEKMEKLLNEMLATSNAHDSRFDALMEESVSAARRTPDEKVDEDTGKNVQRDLAMTSSLLLVLQMGEVGERCGRRLLGQARTTRLERVTLLIGCEYVYWL